MDAVLGNTQLSGNVGLIHRYSSVCHGNVINLGNGLLRGDGDWPVAKGVVFQIIPTTFEFSIPLLRRAVFSPSVTTMSS